MNKTNQPWIFIIFCSSCFLINLELLSCIFDLILSYLDAIEDSLVGTGDESLGRFLTATISVTAVRPGLTLSVVYSLVATETCNNSHGPYVINLLIFFYNNRPQFDKQSH